MQTKSSIRVSVQAALSEHPEIQCCYLFGSCAAGRRRSGSDVDLAVAADRPLSADERLALQEDLATELSADVDLLDLRRATGTILRNAMRGECLLCRDPTIKAEFANRLVYDQEDLQPARRRMMHLRREAFIHGH